MTDSKSNIDSKKAYYSDSKVVEGYDELRFKNVGGQYVHQRESRVFMHFLSRSSDRRSILDIPVGTGRMLPDIHLLGFSSVSAADFSEAMIENCRANPANAETQLSKQDIYNTTYPDKSFSFILSSRFFFHSDTQDKLLSEFFRLLRPGGFLVFDTLTWSPRTWSKLWSKELGGNLYTNSLESVERLADKHGFVILSVEPLFIIPSFFYNFLPSLVVKYLNTLEKVWPKAWRTKRVWHFRKK